MKQLLILFFLFSVCLQPSFGQELYFNGTIGLNIGAIPQPIRINQNLLYYWPGSGIKLNAGVEYWTKNNMIWTGQLGYNASFFSRTYYTSAGNAIISESSYSFNWKSVEGTISKFIETEDSRNIDGFSVGAGTSLLIPGTAKLTENNQYLGSAEYSTTVGFHLLFNGYIQVNDIIIVPGGRINIINFKMKSFNSPVYGPPDERFYNQNALGASFMMTFGKLINKVQN